MRCLMIRIQSKSQPPINSGLARGWKLATVFGAKGLLNSGNRLTAMNDYAQGEASQEYGNQFNRLADLYKANAQGYIGDKGANVALFAAQSNAYNQAQRNNDANQLGWSELSMNRQKPGMNPIYRSISQSGGDLNGAIGAIGTRERSGNRKNAARPC